MVNCGGADLKPPSAKLVGLYIGFMVAVVVASLGIYFHFPSAYAVHSLADWMVNLLVCLAFAGGMGIGILCVVIDRPRKPAVKPNGVCKDCNGLRVVQTCITDVTGLELWPCPSCGTWHDVNNARNGYARH